MRGDGVKPVNLETKSGTSTSDNSKSSGGGTDSGGCGTDLGGTHSGDGKPLDPATCVDICGNRPVRLVATTAGTRA